MRIGTVPYLNALPLIHGLKATIFSAPPAQLAQLAYADDIILAPVALPFHDPSWYLLQGPVIGSFGRVETVKLFIKESAQTIEKINKIHFDSESLTAATLLKILLQNSLVPTQGGYLLIGDKVWEDNSGLPSVDLGEVWTKWKGLPFVWACWMTKSPAIGREWKEKLTAQADQNLGNLEKLSEALPSHRCPNPIAYWKNLRYFLGAGQKQAVEAFQKEWSQLTGRPRVPLQWI